MSHHIPHPVRWLAVAFAAAGTSSDATPEAGRLDGLVGLAGIVVIAAIAVWAWHRYRARRAAHELRDRYARRETTSDDYAALAKRLPAASVRQLALGLFALGIVGATPIVLRAAWNELRLETGGVRVVAVVTGKEIDTAARNPDFCVVMYSFVDPRSGRTVRSNDGQDCAGWPAYDRIRVGDPIAITFLADDPSVNGLAGRPLDLGLPVVLAMSVIADVVVIAWSVRLATRWRAHRLAGVAGGA
jgi:hypothetical protein